MAEYDDHCPLCGGPPCDEDKHRRAREAIDDQLEARRKFHAKGGWEY